MRHAKQHKGHPAPLSHMMKHPGGEKSIKRSVRKHSATIVQHTKGPHGGQTKYRFPMPDKAHARNALARLSEAKGLSSADKSKIRNRAHGMLGESKGTKAAHSAFKRMNKKVA